MLTLTHDSRDEGDCSSAPGPFAFDQAWVMINGALVDDVSPTPAIGMWERRSVATELLAGQAVAIAWHFDSADPFSNDGLGWQVYRSRLAAYTRNDCNGNALPGDCEDCNANGFADERDLDSQISDDCNGNWVPDECDVALGDFNGNDVPDDRDGASRLASMVTASLVSSN